MVFTELRNQVQLKFLSPISIPKGGKNEKKKEISKPIHLAIKKRKKEKKKKSSIGIQSMEEVGP